MFREWDVDKLENEMPECMIVEWLEYSDWEISQWTEAILGAIPTAKKMEMTAKPITDPDMKAGLFDRLGATTANG